MLNKIGLTIHWDTLMNFLDKQLDKKTAHITSLTPKELPLLLLMDNINIYRGNKQHHRLFKAYGENMWNFTIRGLLIPRLDNLEDLFACKETATQSQCDVTEFTFKDISIENNGEHFELWNSDKDNYLTELLKDGLCPRTDKALKDMSESDCNHCLSTKTYNVTDDLKISPKSVILDQFGEEFYILKVSHVENLPFDSNSKSFCLKKARDHTEFMLMMSHHKKQMRQYDSQLSSAENHGAMVSNESEDDSSDEDDSDKDGESDEDEPDSGNVGIPRPETTVKNVQKVFRREDQVFISTFDSIKNKLWNSIQSDTLEGFVKELSDNTQVRHLRDHLGRSILHIAVEKQNINLVDCLLHAGFNPNVKETCGITPLLIAVTLKNKATCQLLVNSRACSRGPLFTNIPSPLAIALKIELAEIVEILNPCVSDAEDDDIAAYDPIFSRSTNLPRTHSDSVVTKNFQRATPGFITGVVGDVGTCKTNCGVISRSTAYNLVGIIPGDLHTEGYFAESCFKEQGPGGFHYRIAKVLKRPKLTVEAFKKKLAEGKLDQIRKAVRDGARAYGLAAVLEFKESELYPTEAEMSQWLRATGSHSKLLLEHFKLWLDHSISTSTAFKYRSQMFLFYGPMLELFDLSTKHCWGKARETTYILQLPSLSNHVVNLLGKWPLAFRQLLANNCSINISGRKGCGIELDAFVEAEIVQPLKVYMSGHTSVKMCQRVMGSIDLFKASRGAYTSKTGFDEHTTTRHSVADPFADQLKGAWFCLRNGLLDPKREPEEIPCCYPLDGQGKPSGKVSKAFLDVTEKGVIKISQNFKFKLYDSFPDLRYQLLTDK
ncbi:BRCA1-associated RING domain 1 [Paramuricea clavata]|uniref:BRCA1-associated RING domain 1 n=1 Tax=Paramuricea clavata TaxID=317549 RepID=A0A7D9EXU2_PARCT|nr:BRCA1-associated RING domain 1 [Paramuricea clavata]